MLEFDDIHLFIGERVKLFLLRFKKRANEEFFGKYFHFLYYEAKFIETHFVRKKSSGKADPDCAYSLTDRYFRYCAYRFDKFMEQIIFPIIVSVIASIIMSAITTLLIHRLL